MLVGGGGGARPTSKGLSLKKEAPDVGVAVLNHCYNWVLGRWFVYWDVYCSVLEDRVCQIITNRLKGAFFYMSRS